MKKLPFHYIGEQVMLKTRDKTLLGDVRDCYRYGGDLKLIVRHFNGEPWPFDPSVNQVTILSDQKPERPFPVGPLDRSWCG